MSREACTKRGVGFVASAAIVPVIVANALATTISAGDPRARC